jgi:hypothetical protein
MVPCVPDVSREDGSQDGRNQVRAIGRAKMVILGGGAEATDMEFAAGSRHAVRYEGFKLSGRFRECSRVEVRINFQAEQSPYISDFTTAVHSLPSVCDKLLSFAPCGALVAQPANNTQPCGNMELPRHIRHS